MQQFIQRWLMPKHLLLVIFLSGAVPLIMALISQYGFGLHPCELCIKQRYPYLVIMLIALVGLGWLYASPFQARIILTLALGFSAVSFATGAGIALYHTGVERKWFDASSSGCSSNNAIPDTIEELRAQIMAAPAVRCDEPAFMFLGLSMASWNFLLSLGLCGACFYGIYRYRRLPLVL